MPYCFSVYKQNYHIARASSGETAHSDWCIAGLYCPVMSTGTMKLLMPGFWMYQQFQNYKQMNADQKESIDKQKRIRKTTSKPNGSKYFERKGNHVNGSSCQSLVVTHAYNNGMHAQPPVHSQSLVNGQSSIFTCELRKYSQNLKTFTG